MHRLPCQHLVIVTVGPPLFAVSCSHCCIKAITDIFPMIMCTSSLAPHANCHPATVPIFTAQNGIFRIYFCIILLSLSGCAVTARHNGNLCTLKRVFVWGKYLEGAVYEGFVQVDHHTVPAVVSYTDLRQEELGRRLQRQYTHFTIRVYISEGKTHSHTYWGCDDGSVRVLETIIWLLRVTLKKHLTA